MADEISGGVLFDVDGTLVDTTYLHTVSWWEALRQTEQPVPMATIHRAIGMGSDKLLDHLLGPERDRDADERLRDAHATLYGEYWERLTPLPRAADLLRACAERGLRVVLATSAAEPEVGALRRALAADDVIHTVTSSADAKESKPAPDILQAALAQSGLDAARVVFVGDSVWDVAAAGQLDIPCVGLTCGGTSRGELAGAGAVAVYDDPAALLAALADSPLANGR
ncbi:HAD family hydrolase [Micromonospora endolithica]|uniref:HAD family hydrolase n=1 Tax=Micromonospora endolithica TaxID=230091 RepID=A0A3A9YUW2_9ACTN|nr:HAD family hydrolase [Micromonospora endolithica]RKN39354.1 HAD family hydrolase [Micromonospora endolithica]TWJ22721.1 HAD superfamily hydrolase (TIGR01509 family)/HAD superfamily hydrolase (TIGR01549 family) [Micromonospora endolithica]